MVEGRGRLLLEEPHEVFQRVKDRARREGSCAVLGLSLAFFLTFMFLDLLHDGKFDFGTALGAILGVCMGLMLATLVLSMSPKKPWRLYENGVEVGLRVLNPGFVRYEDCERIAVVQPEHSKTGRVDFYLKDAQGLKERILHIAVGDSEFAYPDVDKIVQVLEEREVEPQFTESYVTEDERSADMIGASVLLSFSALALSWALFDIASTVTSGGPPSWAAAHFEYLLLYWIGHLVFPAILLIAGPLLANHFLRFLMLGEKPPKERMTRRRVLKERWDSSFMTQSLMVYATTVVLYILMFELSSDYWPLSLWLPGTVLLVTMFGGMLLQYWLSIRRRRRLQLR